MAGLELVVGVDRVLNLRTGEVLVLGEASLDDLAEARDALKGVYYGQREAARLIDAELVRRADAATLAGEDFGHGQRFRVYPSRSQSFEYDGNPIRADLLQRVNRGELPGIARGAIERLFGVAQWRFELSEWRKLEQNPTLPVESRQRLTEIVESHATPKRRTVKIEPRNVVEGSATEESEAAA